MESDIEQQHHRQMNSGGLSRYRSAPSSYFTSLIDRKFCEQFVSRPSSPETERIFARFMTSGSAAEADRKTLYLAPTVKSEVADANNLHQNQWKWKPPLPNKNINPGIEATYSYDFNSPAELPPQINVESGLSFEDGAMLLDDAKMSGNQYIEPGIQGPLLARHLSLPYSKSGAVVVQLSDSVPCKIRAKRGCATHPRSIAERVRRTRISERIRKLQEIVPNMDKHANTSEMLDLAIEYIKGLQKQVQTLSNNHENCRCSNKQLRQY